MKRIAAGALAISGIWIALGQQASETAREPATTFHAGARLTLIPVVVRDRNGRIIDDLTQASFEVFDNGKPRAITSFEVEQAAGAGPSAQHFTTYFFDDLSLNDISAVAPLRDAALQNLAALQPGAG